MEVDRAKLVFAGRVRQHQPYDAGGKAGKSGNVRHKDGAQQCKHRAGAQGNAQGVGEAAIPFFALIINAGRGDDGLRLQAHKNHQQALIGIVDGVHSVVIRTQQPRENRDGEKADAVKQNRAEHIKKRNLIETLVFFFHSVIHSPVFAEWPSVPPKEPPKSRVRPHKGSPKGYFRRSVRRHERHRLLPRFARIGKGGQDRDVHRADRLYCRRNQPMVLLAHRPGQQRMQLRRCPVKRIAYAIPRKALPSAQFTEA